MNDQTRPDPRQRRFLVRTAILSLLLIFGGCATSQPVTRLDTGQTGTIVFTSATVTDTEFLTGAKGMPAVISGELRLPNKQARRVPAVILIHGLGGVGDREGQWARMLNDTGLAIFLVDSYSGRGLSPVTANRITWMSMLVDAYRALDLVATHPAIDPDRIALMGFSRGGYVTLYGSLTRLRKLQGGTRDFAAFVAFYPCCNLRFYDDSQVSNHPIRVLHGTADDWTPIGPCREYVARLRQLGKNADLVEFPGARHAFDHGSPTRHLPFAPNVTRCFLEEREPGRLVNRETGQLYAGVNDLCITRGATIGDDPAATKKAGEVVRSFFVETFRLR